MEEKLHIHLSVEKDGHQFTFSMPVGCPLGIVYDAAFEVLEQIMVHAQKAVENAKKRPDVEKDNEA